MYKLKLWYSLEKNNGIWTVWLNKEYENKTRGAGGCQKIYSSQSKEECIKYCKEKDIKLMKGNIK